MRQQQLTKAQRLEILFEAFNRRDFDGALQYAHPDVELRPALTELDVRTHYRGKEDVKQFMETITEAWETYLIEPRETIESAGNRVLVVEAWHATGRDGIKFDFELYDVYTFEDGLIVRIDGFRDRVEALSAVERTEV